MAPPDPANPPTGPDTVAPGLDSSDARSRRPVCRDKTTGAAPARRKSRAGKWRAGVLIGVHVLIAIHVAHWLTTGSTVSPLEPSEAMEFSKHSVINAGLIFFALAAISTLLLGRFFCGWACHVVALQDLSRWILMKFGITPRPLRSRLLALVPLGAFFYMFLWPLVWRLVNQPDLGPIESEIVVSDFWATFPGPAVAILTLVFAGFACVYFLGAKGYCNYACPYGALFGVVDRVAPFRIRVNDSCEQCGHCTAVCSSNVRVHEEVWQFGAVVDPACMKCMDCVSVCPMEALRYGFGKPAVMTRARSDTPTRKRRPALAWFDEAVLVIGFALGLATFYKPIPFLFALGIAAVLATLLMLMVRLIRGKDVAIARWRVTRDGKLAGRGGAAFVVLLVVAGLWWSHAAAVRVVRIVAESRYSATRDLIPVGENPYAIPFELSGEEADQVRRAADAARLLDRLDLHEDGVNEIRLTWLSWLERDGAAAERHLLRANEILVTNMNLRREAALFYLAPDIGIGGLSPRPDGEAAERWLRDGLDRADSDHDVIRLRFETLADAGFVDLAAGLYESALERFPDSALVNLAAGNFEARRSNYPRAVELYEKTVSLNRNSAQARSNLGAILLQLNRPEEALGHCLEAERLDPDDPQILVAAGRALLANGEATEARGRFLTAIEKNPSSIAAHASLASLYNQIGDAENAEKHARIANQLARPPAPEAAPAAQPSAPVD